MRARAQPDDSDHVRLAVLEEVVRGMRSNLKLQAAEYSRRLGELNHAHEKQVQDQRTYVSEDKFNGYTAELAAFQAKVNEALARGDGRLGASTSARTNLVQVTSVLIALAAVVIASLTLVLHPS